MEDYDSDYKIADQKIVKRNLRILVIAIGNEES